jgi:NDP-sugar pyrophosphorylase family protein
MKAIILAAGKGNRLKPYTDTLPKPLLSLHNTSDDRDTLLTDILTKLPSYIDEVIIIVKYLEETIREYVLKHDTYIKKKNPHIQQITCITQTGGKGTMGALMTVQDHIQKDERFLVLNGDDVHSTEELEKFNEYPRAFGVHKKVMLGYKSIQVDEKGIVTELRTQTDEEKQNGCLIATGVYLLDGHIFDFEPVVLIDGELGLPQTLIAHVDTYPSYVVEEKSWVSVNTVEDLKSLWNLTA